jgi:hypothetical protein
MRHPGAVLAIGIAVSAVIAGCALAWGAPPPRPWSVEQVLYPAGTVLQVPSSGFTIFEVPSGGGVFVGSARVYSDGSLGVEQPGVFIHCPARIGNASPVWWTYSENESLASGPYYWPGGCGSWTEVNVTQAIELLFP